MSIFYVKNVKCWRIISHEDFFFMRKNEDFIGEKGKRDKITQDLNLSQQN